MIIYTYCGAKIGYLLFTSLAIGQHRLKNDPQWLQGLITFRGGNFIAPIVGSQVPPNQIIEDPYTGERQRSPRHSALIWTLDNVGRQFISVAGGMDVDGPTFNMSQLNNTIKTWSGKLGSRRCPAKGSRGTQCLGLIIDGSCYCFCACLARAIWGDYIDSL